jgi:phage protein D
MQKKTKGWNVYKKTRKKQKNNPMTEQKSRNLSLNENESNKKTNNHTSPMRLKNPVERNDKLLLQSNSR